jgi:beta-glucanase (GH16 family)
MIVPHDIDWVKDRVRWYWDHKLVKHRKASDPITTEPGKNEDLSSTTSANTTTSPAIVAANETPIVV